MLRPIRSVNAGYDPEGYYRVAYPPVPNYDPKCPNNVEWDTLPPNAPWRDTVLGPTSLKHLYRGPRNYPVQTMRVPDGTMYDRDTSVYWAYGNRRTYGKQLYPFHQRSPREVIEYSSRLLPMPNIFEWTRKDVVTDGAWGR